MNLNDSIPKLRTQKESTLKERMHLKDKLLIDNTPRDSITKHRTLRDCTLKEIMHLKVIIKRQHSKR